MTGTDLALSYDPDLLEVVAVEKGGLATGFSLEKNDVTLGVLRLSLATTESLSEDSGDLAVVEFRVKSSAPLGSRSPLALTLARLNDLNGLDFATSAWQREVQAQGGQLTIGHQGFLPLVLRNH